MLKGLLTESLIYQAFSMIKPVIMPLIEKDQESKGIHIVLITDKYKEGDDINEHIDWKIALGTCKKENKRAAIDMARVSWRLSAPSGFASEYRKFSLEDGDLPRAGAVCDTSEHHTLVISTCGLTDDQNEFVSMLLLITINHLVDVAVHDLKKNGGENGGIVQ